MEIADSKPVQQRCDGMESPESFAQGSRTAHLSDVSVGELLGLQINGHRSAVPERPDALGEASHRILGLDSEGASEARSESTPRHSTERDGSVHEESVDRYRRKGHGIHGPGRSSDCDLPVGDRGRQQAGSSRCPGSAAGRLTTRRARGPRTRTGRSSGLCRHGHRMNIYIFRIVGSCWF